MAHPGERIGQYELLEQVGAGGSASVWRARHNLLGSEHALKVLTALNPDVAQRLLREGQVQARLRHPNIVPVTDLVQDGSRVALVMEYVSGGTLLDQLQARGALPLRDALEMFSMLLDALAYAHRAGVLHRDLKPANVLMDDGLPRIADFGLARVSDPTELPITRQGIAMGTPGYMSPEQWADPGSIDARADIFSMGVILYEVLTCHSPFRGRNAAEMLEATVSGRYPDLRSLLPGCPPGVASAVDACLRPRREDRVSSAEELAQLLGLALGRNSRERALAVRNTPSPPPREPADYTLPPPLDDNRTVDVMQGPDLMERMAAAGRAESELVHEAEPEAEPEAQPEALPSPQHEPTLPPDAEPSPQPTPTASRITPRGAGPVYAFLALVLALGASLLAMGLKGDPEAAPEPARSPVLAIAPKPQVEVPPCQAPEGSLVGYWYAGPSMDSASGELWTLTVPLSVRARFPEGSLDAGELVCTLPVGATLRVGEVVSNVRGARWITLRGGDVQ